ncbi:MAG: hypothetical protein GKS00_28585 [Alphaproteobacteria bacterium]|nr:hypothetical protein [Alphaproteobacteria bacterium]
MTREPIAIVDSILQVAAIAAVIFVLNAGIARGAMLPEREHAIIEEALRADVSPSLALAVATVADTRHTRRGIRADIEALGVLLKRYPERRDLALLHHREKSGFRGLAPRRYVAEVQAWVRHFDADARAAIQALRSPPRAARPTLDDFDGTMASRVRRARRTLDDFPLRRRG